MRKSDPAGSEVASSAVVGVAKRVMSATDASPDAGVLLEISGTGDLKVHSKQIGLELGTARHGDLHVLAVADRGL